MDVKEAIKTAKQYVSDVFAEEGLTDLGLEEIEREEPGGWRVTLGFSRPWNKRRSVYNVAPGDPPFAGRTYKVIAINDNGDVTSVKHREFAS